jgi:hypothetical protein
MMATTLPKTTAAALLAGLLLGGCVESSAPLLTGAQPVFGPDVTVHIYELGEKRAVDPEIGVYHWTGSEYRTADNPKFEVAAFTAAPLAGNDFIIQSRSTRPQVKNLEYGIARKIADNTYMVVAIDESSADEATRRKFCADPKADTCMVTSRDGIVAFARAAAAKPELKGSLAILVGAREP